MFIAPRDYGASDRIRRGDSSLVPDLSYPSLTMKLPEVVPASALRRRPIPPAPSEFLGTRAEFIGRYLNPVLPAVSMVEAFHRALVAYVERPDAVFLVRKVSGMERRTVVSTRDGTALMPTDNALHGGGTPCFSTPCPSRRNKCQRSSGRPPVTYTTCRGHRRLTTLAGTSPTCSAREMATPNGKVGRDRRWCGASFETSTRATSSTFRRSPESAHFVCVPAGRTSSKKRFVTPAVRLSALRRRPLGAG